MTTTIINLDDRTREQRFDEMVRNHRARVTRIVYNYIGNWSDAEEGVQDALVKMWADRVRLDSVADPVVWLIAEAKYRAIDAARARRKTTPSLLGEHVERVEHVHREPADERCLADDDVMERVNAALAAMPPRTREAIRLYCLEGLSRSEVAAQMGVKPGTVTYWLYTALHELDLSGPEWSDPRREASLQSPEARLVRSCPQLLKLLPEAQREAVKLRYVEQMSAPEAAKVLNTTISSIKARVSRARLTLRALRTDLATA